MEENEKPRVVWPTANLPTTAAKWVRQVQKTIDRLNTRLGNMDLSTKRAIKALDINLGINSRSTTLLQEQQQFISEQVELLNYNANVETFTVLGGTIGTSTRVEVTELPDPYIYEGNTTIRVTSTARANRNTNDGATIARVTGSSHVTFTILNNNVLGTINVAPITAARTDTTPSPAYETYSSNSFILRVGDYERPEITLNISAILTTLTGISSSIRTTVEIINNVRYRQTPYIPPA